MYSTAAILESCDRYHLCQDRPTKYVHLSYDFSETHDVIAGRRRRRDRNDYVQYRELELASRELRYVLNYQDRPAD